jgi:hypothetical protein
MCGTECGQLDDNRKDRCQIKLFPTSASYLEKVLVPDRFGCGSPGESQADPMLSPSDL